ncbi:MAG: plasmid mobilization protein [Sulfuricella sp.]
MAARSESRQKTKLIQVRATPAEKEKLRARAAAFGISMGELCRQAIFNSTPKSKTDQGAIQELSTTRADLGRLGGLLKGWLAGSFPTGVPVPKTHADVVTLLHEVQEAQRLVVESVKNVVGK